MDKQTLGDSTAPRLLPASGELLVSGLPAPEIIMIIIINYHFQVPFLPGSQEATQFTHACV